jgi:hypothetical protein
MSWMIAASTFSAVVRFGSALRRAAVKRDGRSSGAMAEETDAFMTFGSLM